MKLFYIMLFIFVASLLFTKCDGDDGDFPTGPDISADMTVTGTIINPDNVNIPEDATVYAVWFTKREDLKDERFVWGKGDVDLNNMTFSISFDTPPNDKAMVALDSAEANDFELGVAYLMLIADDNFNNRFIDESDLDDIEYYGAVENTAVIYVQNIENRYSVYDWVLNFMEGYNIGIKDTTLYDGREGWKVGLEHGLVLEVTTTFDELEFPQWRIK